METKAQKVNECFAKARTLKAAERLFDAYWQEGELVMLTGPQESGKSLLAVQIAEALARGREIANFKMPGKRRKVLYVDLVLSNAQFQRRYAVTG